ncbi:hypothetical protein [Alteromonas sp. RKMC-009]|uniref:hypothetical protein n=1 Tax=Alteromonas sp. RKMC-009 TaxID=2267264 RepID=UPI000E69FC13|nr:hypothetical protein [Alteromonas sp. RKMC-009]AYA64267.1 hypothetical protein DS731_09830 [Alteromonas sp. RKMC-009]
MSQQTFDACVVNSQTGSVVKREPCNDQYEAAAKCRTMQKEVNPEQYHTEVRKGLSTYAI